MKVQLFALRSAVNLGQPRGGGAGRVGWCSISQFGGPRGTASRYILVDSVLLQTSAIVVNVSNTSYFVVLGFVMKSACLEITALINRNYKETHYDE